MGGNKKADDLKTNKPNNLEKKWLKPEYTEGKQKNRLFAAKKAIICDRPLHVKISTFPKL